MTGTRRRYVRLDGSHAVEQKIFQYLFDEGPQTLESIAELTLLDESYLRKVLSEMQEEGLIQREKLSKKNKLNYFFVP